MTSFTVPGLSAEQGLTVSNTLQQRLSTYNDLHLTLKHNSKSVYDVPATATLLDRIGLFFGEEVSNQLYLLTTKQGPVTLNGYLADPACSRGHGPAAARRWQRPAPAPSGSSRTPGRRPRGRSSGLDRGRRVARRSSGARAWRSGPRRGRAD